MPASYPRRLSALVLLVAAASALSCDGLGGGGDRLMLPNEPYDRMLPPLTRQPRFRPTERDFPTVIAQQLTIGGRKRFVLLTAPLDGDEALIIADSEGTIPTFESRAEAHAYAARFFRDGLEGLSAEELAAMLRDYVRMLAPPVDLDGVRKWAEEPTTTPPRPVDAARAWSFLATAEAAPPLTSFDPMYFVSMGEKESEMEGDSAPLLIAMTGMKLSARIRLDPATARFLGIPSLTDTAFWSPANSAMLAAILRRGIADVERRLSDDAAQRDVRQTWREPQALLRLVLKSPWEGRVTQPRMTPPLTDAALEEEVRTRTPTVLTRERLGVSAGAYARYLRDHAGYVEDLRAYHRADYERYERSRRRFSVAGLLFNDGPVASGALLERWRLPASVELVDGVMEFRMVDPLREPRAYEDPSVRRQRFTAPVLRRDEADRERAGWSVRAGPAGSTIIERPVSVHARDGVQLRPPELLYRDRTVVQPVEISVEIVAGDSVVVSGALRVEPRVAAEQD